METQTEEAKGRPPGRFVAARHSTITLRPRHRRNDSPLCPGSDGHANLKVPHAEPPCMLTHAVHRPGRLHRGRRSTAKRPASPGRGNFPSSRSGWVATPPSPSRRPVRPNAHPLAYAGCGNSAAFPRRASLPATRLFMTSERGCRITALCAARRGEGEPRQQRGANWGS